MRDRIPGNRIRLGAWLRQPFLAGGLLSSVAIAGSSLHHAAARIRMRRWPVPAGTKVHTVSAKSATAKFNARLRARGGHSLAIKHPVIRIFKGVGTKAGPGILSPGHHDHTVLAPPTLPTATAGTQMPIVGAGDPIVAAAPLAPASNKPRRATCACS